MINKIKQVAITLMLFGAALGLAGCADVIAKENANSLEERVFYGYDSRTNLCFAVSPNSYGSIVTSVPCTAEVLQLAGKAPQKPVQAVPNPNEN